MQAFSLIAIFYVLMMRFVRYSQTRWNGEALRTPSGKEYAYKDYKPTSKSNGGTLIAIPFDTTLQLAIYHENWWAKLLKKIGCTQEFQTGDAAFDDTFYLEGEHQGVLNVLRQSGKTKQLITSLLDSGKSRILVSGGRLICVENAGMCPPDMRAKKAEELYALKDGLQTAAMQEDRHNGRTIALGFMAIHTALALATVFIFFRMPPSAELTEPLRPLNDLLEWIWIAWLAWAWVIILLLGRTSRGRLGVTDFLLVGLPSSLVLAYYIVEDINVTQDTSLPRVVEAVVVKHYSTQSRRSTHYHTMVRHWDKPDELYDFSSSWLFQETQVGSKVTFNVFPGHLGYQWVSGVRKVK